MLYDVKYVHPNLNKVVATNFYPLWGECLGVDRRGSITGLFEGKMKQNEKHVSCENHLICVVLLVMGGYKKVRDDSKMVSKWRCFDANPSDLV